MPRKITNILELVKTAAVLLLMVMLVCLCVIYMISYQNTGQYSFTKDTMKTLGGESVKYQYADYFEASYVSPKFVGFSAKKWGDNIGFYTLGGENAEVCASLLPFYEKLFSEKGSVTPLSSEEGKTLFEALQEGDYIYAAYESDLPKSLIYAMSAENATASVGSGEYIREIMIVPGRYLYDGVIKASSGTQVYTSVYTFYAVSRDSEGNYYRYTTDFVPSAPTDVSFNTNYYLTYTTTESCFSYEFAGLWELDEYFLRHRFKERVTDTTVIPKDRETVFMGKTIYASSFSPEKSTMDALLDALLINPEKVTSFTDGSGVRFYYDEGRNVSISPSGHLEYTAYGEEGLPLSELFEYPASNEVYDARDYIGASLVLARSLEDAAGVRGVYDLFLSGVYSDGETLTVTFGYAMDGMPMYFDGYSDILCFEFENGMLKKVSYDLRRITVSADYEVEASVLWELRAAIAESDEKREYTYGYLIRLDEAYGILQIVSKGP